MEEGPLIGIYSAGGGSLLLQVPEAPLAEEGGTTTEPVDNQVVWTFFDLALRLRDLEVKDLPAKLAEALGRLESAHNGQPRLERAIDALEEEACK